MFISIKFNIFQANQQKYRFFHQDIFVCFINEFEVGNVMTHGISK